jgi:hypothetical protein
MGKGLGSGPCVHLAALLHENTTQQRASRRSKSPDSGKPISPDPLFKVNALR